MRAFLATLLLTTAALAQDAPRIDLDSPRAGWRLHTPEASGFMQSVNYPANSSNAGSAPAEALIRGRVVGVGKEPAQLIVNGVAMPQRIEEDGSFARPYAFPAGSNSIELRSADGAQRRRLQFHARAAGGVSPRLRVVLSWDSDHTDLDLHVVSPDGQHAWYGDRSLPNGGGIDVDVTTGYGPEIYAIPSPPRGIWLVYVNYFGGRSADEQALTVATVSILHNEGSIDEKQESFRIPLREAGELALVKRFAVP